MPLKLVILDANVIITAHQLGIWKQIKTQYAVCVPSTVINEEAFYFQDSNGRTQGISLREEVARGDITELTASPEMMAALSKLVKDDYLRTIDAGETEAIALLASGQFEDHRFCTGDARAIQALSVFEVGTQGVSFEKLLESIGSKRALDSHYSEKAFRSSLARGMSEKDLYRK